MYSKSLGKRVLSCPLHLWNCSLHAAGRIIVEAALVQLLPLNFDANETCKTVYHRYVYYVADLYFKLQMLFIGIAYRGPLWIEAMHKDTGWDIEGVGGHNVAVEFVWCVFSAITVLHALFICLPQPILLRDSTSHKPWTSIILSNFIPDNTVFLKFPGLKCGSLKKLCYCLSGSIVGFSDVAGQGSLRATFLGKRGNVADTTSHPHCGKNEAAAKHFTFGVARRKRKIGKKIDSHYFSRATSASAWQHVTTSVKRLPKAVPCRKPCSA